MMTFDLLLALRVFFDVKIAGAAEARAAAANPFAVLPRNSRLLKGFINRLVITNIKKSPLDFK
jgi:hypothetical protein